MTRILVRRLFNMLWAAACFAYSAYAWCEAHWAHHELTALAVGAVGATCLIDYAILTWKAEAEG